MDRREFFIKGAVASAAFAAPMIVTVGPADASTIQSPAPKPPDTTPVEPVEAEIPADPPAKPPADGGTLPFTGVNVKPAVTAGTAALLGGAVTVWAAHKPKSV